MRFFTFCFCVIVISGLAAPTAQAVTAPSAPAQPCVPPAPREIRGDGVDNDCDGKVDEQLTSGQLASLVDAEVASCDRKDPTTVAGQQARALALDGLRAANRLGPSVDPASIELSPPECVEVVLAGHEWDGSGWATAGSASRTARAAMAKADAAQKTADEAKAEAAKKLDKSAWDEYVAQQTAKEAEAAEAEAARWAAYEKEQDDNWNALADIESRQDAGIGLATQKAEDAQVAVINEEEARQAADDNSSKTEVGLFVLGGGQTEVAVDRTTVRGPMFLGTGLRVAWTGRPFDNGFTAGVEGLGAGTCAGTLFGGWFGATGLVGWSNQDLSLLAGAGYGGAVTGLAARTSLTGGHGPLGQARLAWFPGGGNVSLTGSFFLGAESIGVRVEGEELNIPGFRGAAALGAGLRF